MHHYITPYIGAGTEADPFRPRGSDQPIWAAIDLRPDCTILSGRAIVALPVRQDEVGMVYLGEDLDGISAAIKQAFESRFSLTLRANRLRNILPELLLEHAREDGTRWRPIRPSRLRRRLEIWLGGKEPLWMQPVFAGGVSIVDTFDRADADALGTSSDGLFSWTEVVGDTDIVGNAARSITTGSQVLADVSQGAATGQSEGAICRKDSTATVTFYMGGVTFNAGSNEVAQAWKVVAGTFTQLGSNVNIGSLGVGPVTVKLIVDGSTIQVYTGGTLRVNQTDTAIAGNLRTGLRGNSSSSYAQWNNFAAGDVAVAVTPAAAEAAAESASPAVVLGDLAVTPAPVIAGSATVNPAIPSPVVDPSPATARASGADPSMPLWLGFASSAAGGADPTVILGPLSLLPNPAAALAAIQEPLVELGSLLLECDPLSAVADSATPLVVRSPAWITGITKDGSGVPVEGATVRAFRTEDNAYVAQADSGLGGAYTVQVANDITDHFLVAYKDGAPDIAGTSVNTLRGN